jgi:Transcriptional Coactivator p15 (PC4)
MTAMAKKKDEKTATPKESAPAEDTVVDKWRANERELLQVKIRNFKGLTLIDIRRWYRDAEGDLRPGKGISCKPGDLKRLRQALRKADRRINGRR